MVNGQQYTRSEIKKKADKAILGYIRDTMFSYSKCELTNGKAFCSYRYRTKRGIVKWAEVPFAPNQRTKGDFEDILIAYKINMPYPKCPICNRIIRTMYIRLDSELNVKETPDLTVIPDYVWERDSCRLNNPPPERYHR